MRFLVAEDDHDTAKVFRQTLEHRGHIVTLTTNGEDCLKIYSDKLLNVTLHRDPRKHVQPFDAVILEHMIPVVSGLEVAKEILAVNPHQRIIFACEDDKASLKDSLQQLKQSVEILNKPFSEQALIDSVEDKNIYSALKELSVNIGCIKNANLRHEQLREVLYVLKRARSGTAISGGSRKHREYKKEYHSY
ncbi:MAG: response regulator [Nitrososphaeraceae archaeon]|jgi:CheY-like chemotaxis protein|nr:response regulator [Nitrososphaeraceae archaeon]MDW0333145.1 response regulator [Nitrososphaeraceae archaeon]